MIAIDPATALSVTTRVCAGAVMVWVLESAAVREQYAAAGIFAIATSPPGQASFASMIDQHLRGLWLVQFVAAAVLLVAGPFNAVGAVGVTVVLAAHLAMRVRRRLGGDGAEQMATVILVAVFAAAVPVASRLRIDLAVWFVAAQAILSYVTAGVAKLVSPAWRDGTALPGILSTFSHGLPQFGAWLSGRRRLALAMSWFVIGFETGMVVVPLLPPQMVVAALVLAGGFHVACALLMGLNSFLWTFPATYPCILVVSADMGASLYH